MNGSAVLQRSGTNVTVIESDLKAAVMSSLDDLTSEGERDGYKFYPDSLVVGSPQQLADQPPGMFFLNWKSFSSNYRSKIE